MAKITIEQIQKYTNSLKDWKSEGKSSAQECLVIDFKKEFSKSIIDQDMINKTLYFQSGNGNVSIDFDEAGLITKIDIS